MSQIEIVSTCEAHGFRQCMKCLLDPDIRYRRTVAFYTREQIEPNREGCCSQWPKPCSYHEGWADALDTMFTRKDET